MKHFIKRHGWNILLFVNIIFISVIVLEIFQIYVNANRVGEQSIDCLSDSAIHFVIDTYDILDFTFLEEETKEFTLLKRLSDSMPVYDVIYANGFFVEEEGRTFQNDDFHNGKRVFISGCKAGELLQMEPLIYNGAEYNKIGVLKNEDTLSFKYSTFLIESKISEIQGKSELILESTSHRDAEQIYEHIKKRMNEKGYLTKRLDKKVSKIGDVYSLSNIVLEIVILTLLFVSASILLIVFFWMGQYDEIQKVYRLLGLRYLKLKICFQFLLILLAGYGSALLIKKPNSLIVGGYIFLALCCSMFLVVFGCFMMKGAGEWNEKNIDRDSL